MLQRKQICEAQRGQLFAKQGEIIVFSMKSVEVFEGGLLQPPHCTGAFCCLDRGVSSQDLLGGFLVCWGAWPQGRSTQYTSVAQRNKAGTVWGFSPVGSLVTWNGVAKAQQGTPHVGLTRDCLFFLLETLP